MTLAERNQRTCDAKRIAATLRARRQAAGITQAHVAGVMKTSRPNIARLEQGRFAARIDTIQRYCDAIGIAVSDVFREEESEV